MIITNCRMKLAAEKAVCLVSECWLAKRCLSLKYRRHVFFVFFLITRRAVISRNLHPFCPVIFVVSFIFRANVSCGCFCLAWWSGKSLFPLKPPEATAGVRFRKGSKPSKVNTSSFFILRQDKTRCKTQLAQMAFKGLSACLMLSLGVASIIIWIVLLLLCVIRVFPCHRLLGLLLSKSGHGIFNVCNDLVRAVHA